MPRPDSGFLSGVLAGIDQFKKTKAFYQQMETSDLQNERLRSASEYDRMRIDSYETPEAKRAADLEVLRERAKIAQGLEDETRERRFGYYDVEGPLPEGTYLDADGNIQQDAAYWNNKRAAGAGTGGRTGTGKPPMSLKDAWGEIGPALEMWGVEGGMAALSPQAKTQVVGLAQQGQFGLAEMVAKHDVLTRDPQFAWLRDINPESKGYFAEDPEMSNADYMQTRIADGLRRGLTIQEIRVDLAPDRRAMMEQGIIPRGVAINAGGMRLPTPWGTVDLSGLGEWKKQMDDEVKTGLSILFPYEADKLWQDRVESRPSSGAGGSVMDNLEDFTPARDIHGSRTGDGASFATGAAQTGLRDWGKDRGYGIGVQVQYKGMAATILGAWPIKWTATGTGDQIPTEFELRLQLPDGKVVDSVPTSQVGG